MHRATLATLAALSFVALAVVVAAPAAAEGYCYWNPDFRDFVYAASGGVVHLHDGPICTVHLHRPALP